ncbi:Ubiquitin family [Seminavis robusta]|uniref:Ubiquitin family n=1 Tax=Seminavis robusta TaxID=568900 RepID=A0A9N8HI15_9STRA|nr:Ubiquitin family [Seminavis robusta]|eukprot:Sro476_g150620.1 Ubiquitin family (902) ;mRNA; r:55554-58362
MAAAVGSDETSWSLSVKAIGSTLKECTTGGHDSEAEKNFTVTVSPEDTLHKLYDQIEEITGLKASQQRLIYRGRLIENLEEQNNSEETTARLKVDPDEQPKVKDIVGLGDGHTIHLVKRKETPQSENANNNNSSSTSATTATTTGSSTLDRDESLSGNGTASLLAALIGLGGLDDGDTNDATAATSTGRNRLGWRGGRLGRSRRPHYRLTAEDLQSPDPGTLEPVRQGLMTIHTMLPHAQVSETHDMMSPLDANRRWYRGQWIDVRDTVNQWLEATVVDIMTPDEILPAKEENDQGDAGNIPILEPATDPAVSAGDLDGRRRLLLEPCDEGDSDDEGGELAGFRRRRTNGGVQLLLIHYNGWPHRWDEWVRSDSERIRPFRTRTRHPSMANHSSPTTQSSFNESPSTHIVDTDNTLERPAILPELSRAVAAINDLLSVVAAEESAQLTPDRQDDLPWAMRSNNTTNTTTGTGVLDSDDNDDDELEDLPPLEAEDANEENAAAAELSSSSNTHHNEPRLRRRQLQLLAPLLDRLGRTLIDAAPHVAALANSSPTPDNDTEESISTAEAVVAPAAASEDNPSTLGGLLSLLSRDRNRQTNNASSEENDGASPSNTIQTWPVDPDYVDFATGVVNTTRGEVRSGPRSRTPNDDVAGLLGAYLAAASLGLNAGGGGSSSGVGDADNNNSNNDDASNVLGLGRLLRDRGGNGGGNGGAGIDIHIHAVVTAPGMPPTAIGGVTGGAAGGPGGLGFATLGNATTGTIAGTRNSLSPTRERRGSGANSLLRLRTPASAEEDDDLGLFSDLYSESPEPLDPSGSPDNNTRGGRDDGATVLDNDFLSRLGGTPTRPSTQTSGRGDPHGASPSRHSSASDSSSRRSSTNGASPRRGSMLGRLFRRSRRGSSS